MGGRLKLLIVSSSLGEGGAQRVTSTLLAHLDRNRFEPHLCLFRRKIDFALPDDVPVVAFQGADTPRIAELARKRPWIVGKLLAWLRSRIDSVGPDLVVSNIDQANLLVGTALRTTRSRPRWIARIGTALANQTRWQRIATRWAYRRAERIVVNSEGLKGNVERLYPELGQRVVHLPNPVDLDRLDRLAAEAPRCSRPTDLPLVITVGRFVKEKRNDLLLAAVAKIRRRLPLKVWICAEGPLRTRVEKEIADKQLQDTVELLGFCDNPYALMKQASVFVLMSDFEGLPNALLEAQVLGVPAVATDCEFGPSEIVKHGVTGLLTPTGDADSLAEAIASLLEDDARRASMAVEASALTRGRYGVAGLIGRWQDLLSGAAGC